MQKPKFTVFFLLLFFALSTELYAAGKPAKKEKAAIDEGVKLYRSELASWRGTDIFLEQAKGRSEKIGGYFSYEDAPNIKCVFYEKGDNPSVIGTVIFDSTFNVATASLDLSIRSFTTQEKDIYELRNAAVQEIYSDTLYKKYENSNLNLVPLINGKERKVYVLTGPQVTGVVIFGNDYLLTFDKNNKLKTRKKLHQNILIIKYNEAGTDSKETVSMHSHADATGHYLTPTDVCTLLLYENQAGWSQHILVTSKNVTIWDCKKNQAFTLKRSVWEKIMKHQEKQKSEN